MLLADFHIHTCNSKDSDLSVETILKKARKIGLNVLGIVDHDSLFKENIKTDKITIFFGEEIKTNEGEVIGFEIKKDIEPRLDLIETCKQIKKQGGLVFVPHPFDIYRHCVGNKIYDIIKYVDLIEGFNSRCTFSYFNKQAMDFAKKHNIPAVGGSDAHFEYEIGSCITLIESKNKKEDIIRAIKNGQVLIEGKKTGLRPHLGTFKLRLIKNSGKLWKK